MKAQDLIPEIQWRSSRAGGKGGQNVNKVETAVEAIWSVAETKLFSEEEKIRLLNKLRYRLNKEGCLAIRATNHRSQLENKTLALEKLWKTIQEALFVPKTRKPTRPSRAAKERRIEDKKHNAFRKAQRQKYSE